MPFRDGQQPKRRLALLVCLLVSFSGGIATSWKHPESPSPTGIYALYAPQLVRPPSAAPLAVSWGAPIAVSRRDGRVWVVNPDSASVSVIEANGGLVSTEIPLEIGSEPQSLAISPSGEILYIVDRAGGLLLALDTATQQETGRVTVGPEPGMVVLGSGRAYVSVTSAGEVVVVDTTSLQVVQHIHTPPAPYALALDGDRLYVTHRLARPAPGALEASDTSREGIVSVIQAAAGRVVAEIPLPADEHGFPNLLNSIAISGGRAWLAVQRDAPASPNDLIHTVFAAAVALDLAGGVEDLSARLELNDLLTFGSPVNLPSFAVPAPDGKRLYLTLAGSNLLEIVDVADPAHPALVRFLPVGKNPRGLALDPDGRRGYISNLLSRSVTVVDLQALRVLGEVSVAGETLDPQVLLGKTLFNTAGDPRLTRGGWMACASCHPDGGNDGVTWRLPDGPRQTPVLWNAGKTLPWHWSANFDQPQDVDLTIIRLQQGLGFLPGGDPPVLKADLSGKSPELDALAAYLLRGIRAPAPPPVGGDVAGGRALFSSAGCTACHGGPGWTSSALPAPPGSNDLDGNGMVDSSLRDVGTLNPADLQGASGFDPPSLLDTGLTAPYFHDGSMPDFETLLSSGHPDPHGIGNGLTPTQIAALAAFLRSIGPDTPPEGGTK